MTTEQIQEIPQPIQPVQQVPVEPKKKLNLSTIVILLIVILLVGIGGVYAGIKIGKKQVVGELVQKVTPAPISQPTVIPTPDETVYTEQGRSANWKTYTNTKYGYTIKYPVEWNAKVKCEGGITEDDYICLLSPDFEESPAGAVMGSTTKGGLIWIDGRGDLVGSSIDKFCTPSVMTFSDCTEITISNIKGMQRTWANKTTTQVGLVKNNKFVVSLFIVYNDTSRTEILNTFDQILSTFKFLP